MSLLALMLAFGLGAVVAHLARRRRRLPPQRDLYRAAFDAARDGLFILDDQGRFIDANPAMLSILRCSRAEVVRQRFGTLAPFSAERPDLRALSKKTGHVAMRRVDVDRTLELGCATVEVDGRRLVLGRARDVTEQVQDRQRLARLRAAMEAAVNGIFLVEGGRIVYRNAAAAPWLTGASQESILAAAGSTASGVTRLEVARGEPDPRVGTIDLTPISEDVLVGIILDVTDEREALARQRAAEEDLHRVQRMQSLGLLAGGIAHDMNNLLTTIVGYGTLARQAAGAGAARHLDAVLRSTERAVTLMRNLREFSQHRGQALEDLSLSDLMDEARPLLASSLGETAVVVQRPPGQLMVKGCRAQLLQMMLTLALRDHGREGSPVTRRRVKVSLSAVQLDLEQAAARRLPRGTYARVEVVDDGPPLPREARERMFEPFSKVCADPLTMAATYGIVVRHGGRIAALELPTGAAFEVLLPALESPADDARPRPLAREAALAGRRVVVVDDDAGIAELAGQVLEGAGASVVVFSDPLQALTDLRCTRADLLVSDIVMPQLSGVELARGALDASPGLKVLLMTGYASAAVPCGVPVIEKPFEPAQLLQRAAEALAVEEPLVQVARVA